MPFWGLKIKVIESRKTVPRAVKYLDFGKKLAKTTIASIERFFTSTTEVY